VNLTKEMMMPKKTRFAAMALTVLIAACAGTPGPGEPGYAHNATGEYAGDFVVDGQPVSGTLQLETVPGGVVTGSFRIPDLGIRGQITGSVIGDQFAFEATYHNPESGCDGVATSTATIGEGGTTIEGPLSVAECGQSMGGSMSFRR
jgi:hypothetical protein